MAFSSLRVMQGGGGVGNLSVGTVTLYDNDVGGNDITALDTSIYLVVYTNAAKSALYARIIDTSSGISVGSEQTIATGVNVTVGDFSVAKISSTKAVMSYCDAPAVKTYVYNLAISGTSVVPSTRLTVASNSCTVCAIAVLDSDYALVDFNTDNSYLIDVSGTNPSNVDSISAHSSTTDTVACINIDGTDVMVGSANSGTVTGIIVRNTAGTLSKGTAATLLTGASGGGVDLAKVSATKVFTLGFVAEVKMEHTTVSGTSLTSGTQSNVGSSLSIPIAVTTNNPLSVVALAKDSSNNFYAYLINTSSTNPSVSSSQIVADTATYGAINLGKIDNSINGKNGAVFINTSTSAGYFVEISA